MEEVIISLETAKLAKQKGLGIGDFMLCYTEDRLHLNPSFVSHKWEGEQEHYHIEALERQKNDYPASTQSLLQKWLREQETPIIVTPTTDFIAWQVEILHPDLELKTILIDPESNFYINSYERALELGLQYGLNLIK